MTRQVSREEVSRALRLYFPRTPQPKRFDAIAALARLAAYPGRLLGHFEFSEICAMNPSTFQSWRKTNAPRPDDEVRAGPIWRRRTVQRWLERRLA